MSLAYKSVATIKSPQFINLQPLDVNPYMSACEIKVFYIGQNRNKTFISKQVAAEMAKTLRGAPIVGYFKQENDDFRDHGEEITIDGDGVHFACKTIPYGFVDPDAQVWFKDFQDQDGMGNKITRTYLMTTGYLWTGQFQEAAKVFNDNGKSHSMQLDKENLHGYWATNFKNNMDFFIINDAIFTKLCILGDDVEPCFQGAGVTKPEVSASFNLDDNFKNSLYSMLQDLRKYTLTKGGNAVADIKEKEQNQQVPEKSVLENEPATDFTKTENNNEQPEQPNSEFVNKEQKEKENKEENNSNPPSNEKGEDGEEKDDDKKKEKDDKYSLLENQYSALKSDFEALQAEIKELREFKLATEQAEKDKLIAKFSMLSDEDKKEVIENKANYTLEEIEAKLALIGFRKGVNFNLEKTSENDNNKKLEDSITTYNVNNSESIPDWVRAVEAVGQTM